MEFHITRSYPNCSDILPNEKYTQTVRICFLPILYSNLYQEKNRKLNSAKKERHLVISKASWVDLLFIFHQNSGSISRATGKRPLTELQIKILSAFRRSWRNKDFSTTFLRFVLMKYLLYIPSKSPAFTGGVK